MYYSLLLWFCLTATLAAQPLRDGHGDPLPDGALTRIGTIRYRFDNHHFVDGAALSADGKLLAFETSSSIRIMDMKDGRCITTIETPRDSSTLPQTLRFSPNGKHLLRLGSKTLHSFNPMTGEKQLALALPEPGVSVSFLPNSTQFAIIQGSGRKVYMFDAEGGDRISTIDLGQEVSALSESGKYYFGKLRIIEAKTAKLTCEFPQDLVRSTSLCVLTPDDRRLCTCNEDGGMQIFDALTGKRLEAIESPKGWQQDLFLGQPSVSPDGAIAYLSQGTGTVFRRDLKNKKWLTPLITSSGLMVPHPDGKRLVVVSNAGMVRQFDSSSLKEFPGPFGFASTPITSVSPDGNRIAIASEDRLDLFEPNGRRLWSTPTSRLIGKPCWSADGMQVASAGGSKAILFDAKTGKILHEFHSPEAGMEFTGLVGFDLKRERLIACLDNGQAVSIFDCASGKSLRFLRPGVRGAMGISPDGASMAFENGSPGVAMLDLYTGRFRVGFQFSPPVRNRHDGMIHDPPCGSFTPDGSHYLSWRENGEAWLWDSTTGEPVGFLETRLKDVSKFAFSSDGLWLTVATSNGNLSLWDLACGKMVVSWAHEHAAESLAFVGLRGLVTASADLSCLVWDMKPRKKPGLAAWSSLADEDALVVYRAVWAFAGDPKGPDLLRAKIAPARSASEVKVRAWIKELGADRFAARESAAKELEALGRLAEPELRAALAKTSNEESRFRIESILSKIPRERSASEVIAARAVAAMELSGAAEARQLLTEWAAGAPAARLTLDAKAALARMNASRP